MSYCRWSDKSDIYVYENVDGYIHVMFPDKYSHYGDKKFKTRSAAITYLLVLESDGLKFPVHVIDTIRKHMKEDGDKIVPKNLD